MFVHMLLNSFNTRHGYIASEREQLMYTIGSMCVLKHVQCFPVTHYIYIFNGYACMGAHAACGRTRCQFKQCQCNGVCVGFFSLSLRRARIYVYTCIRLNDYREPGIFV